MNLHECGAATNATTCTTEFVPKYLMQRSE